MKLEADHIERTIRSWEEAGGPISTEEVIRLTLDWAEANIGTHDHRIKVGAAEIEALAERLDRIGAE